MKKFLLLALLSMPAFGQSVPSFSDSFNTGALDTYKWIVSNWGAPGSIPGVNIGTFSPDALDFSEGMLRIKVSQTFSKEGVLSVGGELQSKIAFGYGTYVWLIRASTTSPTPYGVGTEVTGQISSGFTFIDNSETEVDFEIEGDHPAVMQMTNWISPTLKQNSSAPIPHPAKFSRYKFVWSPGKIMFYIDGVLVSTHTRNVPSAPAYIMINHWGTNSTGWGGLATPNVDRYMFVKSVSFTGGM